MQALTTARLLFLSTLSALIASRRLLVCSFLALGPVVLATAVTLVPGPVPREAVPVLGWFVQIQVVVPLLALVLGSAAIAEEVEDRTLTYLFTRPLVRPAVLLGRWLAALCILELLLLSSTVSFLGILETGRLGTSAWELALFTRPLCLTVLLGGLVYSALFAALGTFLRRPVLLGVAYVFAIEVLLANAPGRAQAATLQFHLRSYLTETGPAFWQLLPSFGFEADPAAEALRTVWVVTVASLLLGSWIVSRREYVLAS